jgi:hypothetical protein
VIAHVAGFPLEELLLPVVSTAGVALVAIRLAWRDRHRSSAPLDGPDAHRRTG